MAALGREHDRWTYAGGQPFFYNANRDINQAFYMDFICKDTAALFEGKRVKRFEAFARIAQRKLNALAQATCLDDLRAPPGNMLEALSGDRVGQYSIRINRQYRICFKWANGAACAVEIVDYH